jgi:hypothetical protein
MNAVAKPVVASSAALSGSQDPLFIIGTGRCGSTVFHDLLAYHPQVSWFTRLVNKYPCHPRYNSMLVTLTGLPGAGALIRRNVSPVEGYRMWEHHFHGFAAPCRDLTAADAFPYAIASIRKMARACVTPSRPRLLLKITGWPRLGFLHAVFPTARFINVIRDGRAVASSLLRVGFWSGFRGPDNWGWGPLSAGQQARWEKAGRSFAALAALEWEVLMDAYQLAKQTVPADHLMEIRYEDLCANPVDVARSAADFAGLPWSRELERGIAALALKSQNDKWKQGLSPAQQEVLTDCVRHCLARWGYVP